MTVVANVRTGGLTLAPRVWPAVPVIALAPGAFVACLLGALLALAFASSGRTLPGVAVGGVAVGWLDAAGIRARLASDLTGPWAAGRVTARLEGRTWTATNAELGLDPDVDAATQAALAYGTRVPLVARVLPWLAAMDGRVDIAVGFRARGDAMARWVDELAVAVARPAVEADLRVADGGLVLREPVAGRELDRRALANALLAPARAGDRTVAVATTPVPTAVDASSFASAAAVSRAVVTPLEIRADDRAVHEDPAGLATLLSIAHVPAGYRVTLDERRLSDWLDALAFALDRPTRDATYLTRADGSLEVMPAQDGIRLDRDALRWTLGSELVRPSASLTRVIEAPFVRAVPALTTDDARRYAPQLTLVARFVTAYPADASRHANISTGAAQLDGVVIPSGASFSFWDRIGPVTVERGYAYAGAIIDNRSDEHVIGGGLCQVSTTLFNAVARAGYQIDERHSHGYYIDRYPLGLDAAVFLPGSDFRWTNDTAVPVLIRSSSTAASVTFELLSVPSGRTVTFGTRQWNLTEAAPDQPADQAFAPGYAVAGRDVLSTRTVLLGGAIVHADVWGSHYAPVWGGPPSER